MALARRKIKSQLEAETGWEVKTHVNGIVDVYPPTQMDEKQARAEVVERVRRLGYTPTIVGARNRKGELCIQFHTPETLDQEGEGGHGFTKDR